MNVIFVCTGNTCRSPMLKCMFENFIEGKDKNICVDSAGMMDHKKPMNVNTQIVLIQHGLQYGNHESKFLSKDLFDKQDVIFVMSKKIKDDIDKLYGKTDKVIGLYELYGDDIFDPYGLGVDAYNKVYDIFDGILGKILSCLEK